MENLVKHLKSLVRIFTLIAIIISNLVPAIGVLYFSWDLLTILFLYWFESAVIGVFNAKKMIIIDKASLKNEVSFFLIHYGLFMLVHFIFLIVFFVVLPTQKTVDPTGILTLLKNVAFGTIFFTISHWVSFHYDFLQSDNSSIPIHTVMFEPYPRILVMHITVIIGAFIIMTTGINKYAIIVLVGAKTLTDIYSYLRQQRRLSVAISPS